MKTWEDCVEFHGHECPGLAIGYRAAIEAQKLLNVTFSSDEEIVCVSENDACGVDAIQIMLGCSIGKGNLLFKFRGNQAFSIFNRSTNKGIRLILKPMDGEMSREERQEYIKSAPDVFDIKEATFETPESAKVFKSLVCSKCGETTMESMMSLEQGEPICMDCTSHYTRFL